MTDDLLDEATRLAGEFNRQFPITAATLRALVERVQQAEAERDDKVRDGRLRLAAAERERDAARGKLDQVREAIDEARRRDDGDEAALRETLAAILDGKTGD